MALEEKNILIEAEMSFKKRAVVSRNWILLDSSGEGIILDLDKYEIMRRVPINARDLRILDPLLSYPSAILGREKAIVLNLEVLLRDPLHGDLILVVEELQRRLPLAIGDGEGDDDELTESTSNEVVTEEENEFPFEFRALEVALEGICSSLDTRTRELEVAAYPALDELTAKVRDELEQLLDHDDDMADLYLSRKSALSASPLSNFGLTKWQMKDEFSTIGSRKSKSSSRTSGITHEKNNRNLKCCLSLTLCRLRVSSTS